MRLPCPECGRFYDDELQWPVCPHESLNESQADPALEGDGIGTLGKVIVVICCVIMLALGVYSLLHQ